MDHMSTSDWERKDNNNKKEGGNSTDASENSWASLPSGRIFAANIPHFIRLLRKRRREEPPSTEPESSSSPKRPSSRAEPVIQDNDKADTKRKVRDIPQVTDLMQYKKEVVDVDDFDFVAVRFYARK